MLQLVIPATELWDERKEEFLYVKETTLQLEHSLVSLSKWESKWCKPFLAKTQKTQEETIDYIRCMTITQNVKPETYYRLNSSHIQQVLDYIDAPMTATFFSEDKSRKKSRRVVTSELIYYWMFSANIPIECQKWHLNRLMTLIRVYNDENQPRKKNNSREQMTKQAELNEARKKKLNTKG